MGRALSVARRVPFTLALGASVLLAALLSGSIWAPLAAIHPGLLRLVGSGVVPLERGRLDTLVTSTFFAGRPLYVWTILASILAFVGAYEYLSGSGRALAVYWSVQIGAAALTAFAVIWPLARAGLPLARHWARSIDVGASDGCFGAAGALAVELPRPRLRRAWLAAQVGYLALAVLLHRQVYD
ncbi:MAG: hypothetical protein IRY97_06360, partial [Thermomicrobiaceae bacterium]|nr:hypothetical protein [Thermomicrobiaceae bacterium]